MKCLYYKDIEVGYKKTAITDRFNINVEGKKRKDRDMFVQYLPLTVACHSMGRLLFI